VTFGVGASLAKIGRGYRRLVPGVCMCQRQNAIHKSCSVTLCGGVCSRRGRGYRTWASSDDRTAGCLPVTPPCCQHVLVC
jgi:hypothetical protein